MNQIMPMRAWERSIKDCLKLFLLQVFIFNSLLLVVWKHLKFVNDPSIFQVIIHECPVQHCLEASQVFVVGMVFFGMFRNNLLDVGNRKLIDIYIFAHPLRQTIERGFISLQGTLFKGASLLVKITVTEKPQSDIFDFFFDENIIQTLFKDSFGLFIVGSGLLFQDH